MKKFKLCLKLFKNAQVRCEISNNVQIINFNASSLSADLKTKNVLKNKLPFVHQTFALQNFHAFSTFLLTLDFARSSRALNYMNLYMLKL